MGSLMQAIRAGLVCLAVAISLLQADPAHSQDGKGGSVSGTVRWEGPEPQIPDFRVVANRKDPGDVLANLAGTMHPNPHRPKVGKGGGIADAFVWLEGIDPKSSEWKGEETRVEFEPKGLVVVQGDRVGSKGVVKRGDKIEISNRDERYHALKVRGANFFQIPLPKRNVPTRKVLAEPGITELGCGGGFYWLRAYLYVTDHPFAVLTDDQGRFRIQDVPPGKYHVAAWLPNWHETGRDLDFESKQTLRVHFAPPAEKRQAIEVKAGAASQFEPVFSAKDFAEK